VNCRIEPQKLKGQTYTAVEMELQNTLSAAPPTPTERKNAAVGWPMLFMLLVAS
jgi:hypothetical protein